MTAMIPRPLRCWRIARDEYALPARSSSRRVRALPGPTRSMRSCPIRYVSIGASPPCDRGGTTTTFLLDLGGQHSAALYSMIHFV